MVLFSLGFLNDRIVLVSDFVILAVPMNSESKILRKYASLRVRMRSNELCVLIK